MKHSILCVDDEVDNVDALERLFRRKFTVLKATSAAQALDLLAKHPVTLIISDQHFAAVDGGTGTDTLLWAGGDAAINLGDLQSRIHNIEVLDLNHTSAVSLTVSLADLVAITSSDNSTLLIKGDSKDSVHMTDAWAADGTHQAGGIDYTQYTPQEDPSHHLWVQNGIQVV